MSRIRTIKPEFFTSEQIVECSTNARLLFVGMWCFCDDAGIHPASVKRLKMEVFPADDFTISQVEIWISELVNHGLLVVYEANGQSYWSVTGWNHQRIDRPSYKYPQPVISTIIQGSFDDNSSNTLRTLDDHSTTEGKGKERKGEESKIKKKHHPETVAAREKIPNPATELIAVFDDALSKVFGEEFRRGFPRADDLVHAQRFSDAGADQEFFGAVVAEKLNILKVGNRPPPGGLSYFGNIIPQALAQARRIGEKAYHTTQDVPPEIDKQRSDQATALSLARVRESINDAEKAGDTARAESWRNILTPEKKKWLDTYEREHGTVKLEAEAP